MIQKKRPQCGFAAYTSIFIHSLSRASELLNLARPDRSIAVATYIVCTVVMISSSTIMAQIKYAPENPDVRAMVRNGVTYLKTNYGGSWGERVLNGFAQLNSFTDNGFRQDPQINDAVQLVLDEIPRFAATLNDGFDGHNLPGVGPGDEVMYRMYEPCFALFLLTEYDDIAYKREIRTLIRFIARRQNDSGGWSDNNQPNSDVFQTQLCCLALWLAHHETMDVSIHHSTKAVDYWVEHSFIDSKSAFKPITNKQPVSQDIAVAAAGSGSLYMLGDVLGVDPSPTRRLSRDQRGSLEDLRLFANRVSVSEAEEILVVQKRIQADEQLARQVDRAGINEAKRQLNVLIANWFHTETLDCPYFTLACFERYATFREKIDGEVSEVPYWYDQGVDYIKRTQLRDGSVISDSDDSPSAHTALAVLFLTRATQRVSNRPHFPVLADGFSFDREIARRNGKFVTEDDGCGVAELLTLMSDNVDLRERSDIADALRVAAASSVEDGALSQQVSILKRLIKNEHWKIRVAAVRALGRTRLIENCPALIIALADPNPIVVQEASIALRFVSRKTDTPSVPEAKSINGEFNTNNIEYEQGVCRLHEFWSQWYRELRPDVHDLP